MAILEIGVAARDFGEGRAQEGDIIFARKPLGHIGKKEAKNLIVFLMDTDKTPSELTALGVDGKRRYNISLDEIDPFMDKAKARNKNVEYQPTVRRNAKDGKIQSMHLPKQNLNMADRGKRPEPILEP